MFKQLFLVGLVLLSSTGKANDLHLNLEENALKVLEQKPNGLTLNAVRDLAVNEEIDIQISYERMIQAQRKIGQARAAYFPYGLGTVGAMYLFNVWNPLFLVELVTSLPSKVFQVQAEKNMSLAQKYTLAALKENIKHQASLLYFNILQEETALRLTKLEMTLTETLIETYRERVALGLATEEELHTIERSFLRTRDTYLRFSSYLSEVKSAFNTMLGKGPLEGRQIELQPMANFLSRDQFTLELSAMVDMARERSNEIVAADYMVNAARKAKRSTKWSVLSFGGIGFGYYSRVQVAGSKIESAKLNRQYVEDNLVNHVYLADNAFNRSLDLFKNERNIFHDTDFYTNSQLERFKSGLIPLDQLVETQLVYLKDFNQMILSHYQAHRKLADLERVIMGDARETVLETNSL